MADKKAGEVLQSKAGIKVLIPTVQYGNVTIDCENVVAGGDDAQARAIALTLEQIKELRKELDNLDEDFFSGK